MKHPFRSSITRIALCILCAATSPAHAARENAAAVASPHDRLQATLDRFARAAEPGTLGIAVFDMHGSAEWHVNGDRSFPMMSVFKAPLAAAVLDRVERGQLALNQRVTITRDQLRPGESDIRDTFQGDRMSFSVDALLHAAVSKSDNTAADALLKVVGGPGVVTAFLRAHGIDGMRVDMGESQVSELFRNLGAASAPPAGETAQQRKQRLQGGLQAYLSDSRNRSTPVAAADFLRKLSTGALLSATSTQYLMTLLREQTNPRRLRTGLPAGVTLADKCGTSPTVNGVTAAFNDIGVMTWPDGRRMIVAVFLTASPASRADRDRLFADLAKAVAQAASSSH
ncbi:hypothetical protein BZL54_04130 [Burkholderia ubonensis subsp. mesacidophila]|uniref:Beta-lactamase n=2 Tax=Burkholderia ubonensis TaxID=101571 RepID=A0A2A4FM08_9BURK|nr:class A beta-lactamase [Burkholderia ubonensis]PCE33700.1 hypothetical protein BZL54_04130 [Burkholderia ubonensis subsp. mesacidophila]